VFGKERFLRTPHSPAGLRADVVADRPDPRLSETAQARARVRVRSPLAGWTSAPGWARVRIKKRAKHIDFKPKRRRVELSQKMWLAHIGTYAILRHNVSD